MTELTPDEKAARYAEGFQRAIESGAWVRPRRAEGFDPGYPEPPRDSGEADAVNGPTALETHHELEGHASSTAGRRRTGSSSSAGDNTPARSPANPDARP